MHPYFNAFLVALCDVHKVMKNTEAKIHQIIKKTKHFQFLQVQTLCRCSREKIGLEIAWHTRYSDIL